MSQQITDSARHKLFTFLTYLGVAAIIAVGWWNADLALYNPETGLGYWFGIIGALLMALLLLYPMRKRARWMKGLGPVRYWFRTHMIFGVAGPVLVIFHSNFNLGSLNSRVALFCTLIVAGSGIVGRYIYAHLHYGLYGRKATLATLRADLDDIRDEDRQADGLRAVVESELADWEDSVLNRDSQVLGALWLAVRTSFQAQLILWRVRRRVAQALAEKVANHPELAKHRKRLQRHANTHARTRATLLRKFAQHRVFERLFSLWHVIHYPLFLLLVVAAIVHVIAVHMY